jgi:acyl-coenzyme A synthetase/AMP-(fatty) acid ligase
MVVYWNTPGGGVEAHETYQQAAQRELWEFVVLRAGQAPSDALVHELQEHVKRTTAPYKYPRRIEFVDALPKTVSGKIRRVELRERERAGKGASPAS